MRPIPVTADSKDALRPDVPLGSEGGVENDAYFEFARRVVRRLGERVGDGHPEDLAALEDLVWRTELALRTAVERLVNPPHNHSWQRIADELGITRQAAMQRFDGITSARRPGGQPTELR